jgi:hypothetical protein
MSLLRSTYLETLPEYDRWGDEEPTCNSIEVHIATTGWHNVHLALQQGELGIEVNMTIHDAIEILRGLSAAIVQAQATPGRDD